jgi:peptidoglycan/LPS O-acetylase OafA/YrhL
MAGAVLGFIDGASAAFTPAARPLIVSIMVASTIKGLLTGVAAGWVARRTNSMAYAVLVGFAVGFALSFAAAAVSPDTAGHYHYFEIILPGAIVGLIAGLLSQRYGALRHPQALKE